MMALKVRVTAEERTKLAQKAAELRALRSDRCGDYFVCVSRVLFLFSCLPLFSTSRCVERIEKKWEWLGSGRGMGTWRAWGWSERREEDCVWRGGGNGMTIGFIDECFIPK